MTQWKKHQGPIAVLLSTLLLSQSLLAGELVEISDFRGCRSIVSSAERLLCYDTIADGGIYNEQQLQQVQEENFGKKEELPEEISVDRLAVTIVRVSKSSSGAHYFYTEDGTIWKQSGSGRWSLNAPFQAEIKAGLMGSFILIPESGKSVKVKRVE